LISLLVSVKLFFLALAALVIAFTYSSSWSKLKSMHYLELIMKVVFIIVSGA